MNEEQPPKCSQCNNQAYAIGSGPPLCIECFAKRPDDAPKPTRLATIALNFGIVQHLEASLTSIRARSGEEVAAALAKLMQAILDSNDLTREAKSAVLEQVGYLATQAAEPAPQRQKAVGKLVIDGLKATFGAAKDLAAIWQTVEPSLRGMTSIDRERLRRDLSDALSAIQRDQDVTGLDALADSLTTLEDPYAFHGRLLQKGLAEMPRNYSALIWSLVQVIAKLEKET